MIAPAAPPPRVVYYSHTGRLGGGERSLVDLLEALDRDRVRPLAITGGDGPLVGRLAQLGVEVEVEPIPEALASATRRRPWSMVLSPSRFACLVAAARRLARRLIGLDADLLHTNSQKAHWIGLVAGRLARVPVVWHFRDILEPGILAYLARFGAARAAATIAISGAVRRSLEGAWNRGKIHVVPNGLAWRTPATPAIPRSPDAARGPVVGIVGQLARWKGQEIFLEAAARVAARQPRATFLVVGGVLFPEAEGDYSRVLVELARSLGIEDRVRFTGHVADARPWIASLDCLVHPTLLPEPFGRVLLEAMDSGVPVVATMGGGADEVLDSPGGTGVLVEPGDPEAIAVAVSRLLADPEGARRMGERGRRRARESFSISRTAEGVLNVYHRVLESPRS